MKVLAMCAAIVIVAFFVISIAGHFLLLGAIAVGAFMLGNGYGRTQLRIQHRRELRQSFRANS